MRISDSLRTRIHELAAQHERLVQQCDDASNDVATIRKRLADLTHELQLLGPSADPTSLRGVIDAVGAPAELLESLAQQQQGCDQWERDCESRLRKLVGFQGTYLEAVRMDPPSLSVIDRIAEQLRQSSEKLSSAEGQAAALKRQRDEASRELQLLQSDDPLPTNEQLQQARAERDRATDELADRAREGEKIDDRVETLRERIRLTDRLVDTIRMHHQEVHKRAVSAQQIRSLDTQIANTAAVIALSTEELRSAQERWHQIWDACGVIADTPDRMKRWLGDHEQLIQSASHLEDQQQRLDQVQRRVQHATSRLRAAVGSVVPAEVVPANVVSANVASVDASGEQVGLVDDQPIQELLSLYDEAVALRSEWTRLRQQHDALSRRRDELAEEFPLAETRLETHRKNLDQWHQDWRRVTQPFVEAEDSTPTVVMSTLRRIDELWRKKRERDILATRIRSIGEDELAFGSRVRRLAAASGMKDVDQGDPGAIAQNLFQRLQTERTAARQREILREQIDDAQRRLAELQQRRANCQIVLQQLCSEVGCHSSDELPEIERRSRERQRIHSSLRDLENQLALLAADESVEEFIQAASQQNSALLNVEIEQQEESLSEIRRSISAVDQEIGALQHELNSMNGSGHASELLQSIQLLAGRIGRDAEEFARLRVASLLLRRAIDHYRSENQSPVLMMAEQIFRQLTCGEYQSLKVDYDAKGKTILFGVRAGESPIDVPAPAMSTGTADALYLSLRLASLRHQLSHGSAIPLIVDDCLIQLDDLRCIAAMNALSELSMRTQVILFTHHQHVIDLATANMKPDEYHIHRLASL